MAAAQAANWLHVHGQPEQAIVVERAFVAQQTHRKSRRPPLKSRKDRFKVSKAQRS